MSQDYLMVEGIFGVAKSVGFRLGPTDVGKHDVTDGRLLMTARLRVSRLQEDGKGTSYRRERGNGRAHELHRADELLKFIASRWLVHFADAVDMSPVETDNILGEDEAAPVDFSRLQAAFDVFSELGTVDEERSNSRQQSIDIRCESKNIVQPEKIVLTKRL